MNPEQEQKSTFQLKFLFPLLFSIVLVVGILIGILIGGNSSDDTKRSFFTKADYDKVEEILRYVENKYVDTIDSQRLFDLAVNEIFQHLDPHSVYISANSLASIKESLNGELEGIGVEFMIVNDTAMVVSPLAGGPSEKLGIQAGDKIVLVEDSVVAGKGFSSNDLMKLLKGAKGTEVNINIKRAGEDNLLAFTITRDQVKLPSVLSSYMMDEVVGYIKLERFSNKTHQEFVRALEDLNNQGMEKLILDLRDNGGGYLDAAVRIADELLSGDKLIVYTEGRSYPRKDYRAKSPGKFEKGELAVLINEHSASASEILAGAIQDWERGTVIGRRSYGKALVQEQISLQEGAAMRLTVARYFTPKGRSIQRSYENGNEAYHKDYYSHVIGANGNADTAVKDTVIFGIMPEIHVPYDTSMEHKLSVQLVNNGLLPQFVYSHYATHKNDFSSYNNVRDFMREYEVDDEMFNGFINFLEKKGYPVETGKMTAASGKIKTLLKAYFAKQLFYYDGYYRVLNQMDNDVQQALHTVNN